MSIGWQYTIVSCEPREKIQMDKSGLEIPDVQELAESNNPVPAWLEKRDGEGWFSKSRIEKRLTQIFGNG